MEDRALLSRVSKEAKYEIDQGKFSIDNRNESLKKVLDNAIY